MTTYLVAFIAAHGAFHGHKCAADTPEAAEQSARRNARLMAGQWSVVAVKEVPADLPQYAYRKAALG